MASQPSVNARRWFSTTGWPKYTFGNAYEANSQVAILSTFDVFIVSPCQSWRCPQLISWQPGGHVAFVLLSSFRSWLSIVSTYLVVRTAFLVLKNIPHDFKSRLQMALKLKRRRDLPTGQEPSTHSPYSRLVGIRAESMRWTSPSNFRR